MQLFEKRNETPAIAGLTMLMCCVLAGGPTMPEATTAEVDTIPGENLLFFFFLTHRWFRILPSVFKDDVPEC